MKSSKRAWRKMNKEEWSAVHTASDFFTQHYIEAQQKISEVIRSLKAEVIIEVGSGTGEPLAKMLEDNDQITHAIGLDFNENFIDSSKAEFTDPRAHWQAGDACDLKNIMDTNFPEIMKIPKKIVLIIGNTLGILPQEIRPLILKQMALTAGSDGYVFQINWTAENFGYALQHFYEKMPALCGGLTNGIFDFSNATFVNPDTGYSTKWWKPEEVEQLVSESNWDVLSMDSIKYGVVCIGRSLSKPNIKLKKELSDTTLSTRDKSRVSEEFEIQSFYDGESIKFYKEIWGGDDIHIGIYESLEKIDSKSEKIKAASDNSKLELQNTAKKYLKDGWMEQGIRMADLGSAYGGMAIFAVKQGINFVSCVEISISSNYECKQKIEKQNLQLFISNPGVRSFSDTGEYENSFHLVVSQESFCHAGEYRDKVIREASRILKNGGILCFSDIMMSENIKDAGKLDSIFKQLKVKDLATMDTYKNLAEENGQEFLEYKDYSTNLKIHYENIKSELELKGDDLDFSKDYQKGLNEKLNDWLENAVLGNLRFGVITFRKK